jgi:transposase
VFCHDTSRLARPGWSTTRRCARFVLRRLIVDRTTVAAVARELGRSWDTVNSIAVEATRTLLVTDTTRLDQVRVIGVDEHRWAHTRGAAGDGYVTVIVDLTPVVAGSGRARLLDLVAGRSAAAMTSWLAARDQAFRERVEVVAMDGFGGYKTAASTALPEAVTVMDPFHVVALAGTKLDLCRQRVQQDTRGHRGRTGDPLYRVRRALRTRTALHRQAADSARRGVRRRGAHRGRGHLVGLPTDHRRLRPPRPPSGQEAADRRDRHAPNGVTSRAR